MENMKTRVYTQAHKPTLHFKHGNFAVILYLFNGTHGTLKHDPAAGQCSVCGTSSKSFHWLVLDSGLGFLTLISNKF
jgi:hypothetical protein